MGKGKSSLEALTAPAPTPYPTIDNEALFAAYAASQSASGHTPLERKNWDVANTPTARYYGYGRELLDDALRALKDTGIENRLARWTHSPRFHCSSDADCQSYESCIAQMCLPKAPLGRSADAREIPQACGAVIVESYNDADCEDPQRKHGRPDVKYYDELDTCFGHGGAGIASSCKLIDGKFHISYFEGGSECQTLLDTFVSAPQGECTQGDWNYIIKKLW